jgi:hypothetical protein
MPDRHEYLEREVDAKLLRFATKWRTSETRIQWISLLSAPGHGNSALLTEFVRRARANEYGLADARIIHVPGRDIFSAPGTLGPVAATVFQLVRVARSRFWSRLLDRVQAQPWLIVEKILLLAFASLLVSASIYATSDHPNLKAAAAWLDYVLDFGQFYLPAHAGWLPVWTLFFLLGNYLYGRIARSNKPPPRQSNLDDEEAQQFTDPRRVYSSLAKMQLFGMVVLVVDDAYALPNREKDLLRGLRNPASEFDGRALIVTLDIENSTRDDWASVREELEPGNMISLPVPSFDILEVQQIAAATVRSEEPDHATLELAQENIKILEEGTRQEMILQAGEEFRTNEDSSGEFDTSLLMAAWAICQEPTVTRKQLRSWVEALKAPPLNSVLAAFNLESPSEPRTLVNEFRKLSLVREDDIVLVLDESRARALRRWLSTNEPLRLRQLHYLWFTIRRGRPSPNDLPTRSAPGTTHGSLKRAAWHASQVTGGSDWRTVNLADDAPALSFPASDIPEQQREEMVTDLAHVLLEAGHLWMEEGELADACDCVVGSLRCLRFSTGPGRVELVSYAANELWRYYFLSGDSKVRDQLKGAMASFPWLEELADWRVYARYEAYLHGDPILPASPELTSVAPADVAGLHRLTQTVWDIRRSERHWLESDPDPELRVPAPRSDAKAALSFSEIELFSISLISALYGRRWNEVRATFAGWQGRLQSSKPAPGSLGFQTVHALGEALYWDRITWSIAALSKAVASHLPDQEASEANSALNWIKSQSPNPEAFTDLAAFQLASDAYQRAAQALALIEFQGILSHCSYYYGDMLRLLGRDRQRKDEIAWYHAWEGL